MEDENACWAQKPVVEIGLGNLPTASILNRTFTLPSNEFHLCSKALETLEHLFLQCDWAAQVWLLAPWPLRMNTLDSISIVDWA